MGISSCCKKPNIDPQDKEPEPEPEPEAEPEPVPQPEPEPCTTCEKTDAPKTTLKEPKKHHHFTEFSYLCIKSTDSSTDIWNSIHFKSDKNHAETIINIMERAKRGEKSFLDNSEQKIGFLHAVSAICKAAQENGQDILNLPYSKDELAEVIVLVAMTLPIHSVPSKILP